jgi:membrane-associated phospholipid phosphatase
MGFRLEVRRWSRRVTSVALVLAGFGGALNAQVPDTTKKKAKSDSAHTADSLKARQDAQRILNQAHIVRWYEAAALVGGTALIAAVDQRAQRTAQKPSNRSAFLGDVANVFRQQGEPYFYGGVSVGVFAVGVIANSPDIRRAGRRLVASVAGAGLMTYALKFLVGRSRPNEGVGGFTFHPFTTLKDSLGIETRGSFPSGHATAAFAVATSLAEDIHSPLGSVLLYTFATGAAWSRIYDNRHWLSDTVFGAALGITTAKVVSGRWRVFGWRPPAFMVRPTGEAALEWKVPLRSTRAGS